MKTKLTLLLSVVLAAPAWAGVLPNDAIVEGKTIGEWSAECWKWIYSISTNENPLLDCDGQGRWANNRQPDPTVFFIAPVNGITPPPCIRTFTVPENKYILLPVLALSIDNIDTFPPYTLEQMHDVLNSVLDEAANLELHASIDGVPVPNLPDHRATSPPFSFDFPDGDNTQSVFYQKPIIGLYDPVIVDGYWLMLEPLSPGPHTLHTGGNNPYSLRHDIICNITVVPIPLTQRVEELIASVDASSLVPKRKHRLLERLRKAQKSFEQGHLAAGIKRLREFQIKVRRAGRRLDPVLAVAFTQAAQGIIDKARSQLL